MADKVPWIFRRRSTSPSLFSFFGNLGPWMDVKISRESRDGCFFFFFGESMLNSWFVGWLVGRS